MGGISVEEFNGLSAAEATTLLETCLAVPRWVDEVASGRPYADTRAVVTTARKSAALLGSAEVDAALARHPRIGERADAGQDGELSRLEQRGVDHSDAATAQALAAGNREYEARFGRVFLIRAAGRTSTEMVAELRRRMHNDPEQEMAEVAAQLAEIALLRLELLLGGTQPAEVAS
jgi:OHCU decarboxylase